MKTRIEMDLVTGSAEETRQFGFQIGAALPEGAIVSLVGPLGAGKTTLVKGIASGLGFAGDVREVSSPTFVLVREYPCRVTLFHIDLYRVDRLEPEDAGALSECLNSPGVKALEWGEKARALYPKNFLIIEMNYSPDGRRRIHLTPQGGFSFV